VIGLGHFKCYKAKKATAPRGQPPFPAFSPLSGLLVEDQFGPVQLDLKKTVGICTPVDKNGSDPTAPSEATHLEGYKVKLTKLDPPQAKFAKSTHTVQNQLGTIRLKLLAVDRLMVPSNKAPGTGGAPPYTANDVDHFKCYKAAKAKGETFAVQTVSLMDQFGGPLYYDLKKPTRLCAPANKENSDPEAPSHAGHLVCYHAKLTRLDTAQPKFEKTRVSTNNQFGPAVIDAIKVEELCIPSLKLD
jgi:hypothetical protein